MLLAKECILAVPLYNIKHRLVSLLVSLYHPTCCGRGKMLQALKSWSFIQYNYTKLMGISKVSTWYLVEARKDIWQFRVVPSRLNIAPKFYTRLISSLLTRLLRIICNGGLFWRLVNYSRFITRKYLSCIVVKVCSKKQLSSYCGISDYSRSEIHLVWVKWWSWTGFLRLSPNRPSFYLQCKYLHPCCWPCVNMFWFVVLGHLFGRLGS